MNLSFEQYLKAFGLGIVLAVLGIGGYVWYQQANAVPEPDTLPTVTVYKSPTCGCCSEWIEHLQANGFTVEARDTSNVTPIKQRLNVPRTLSSCHTAVVGDYVVEGHVPADEVKRLLVNKPKFAGISVPGMPIGSPGMERGNQVDRYNVIAFDENGNSSVVARYGDE